MVRIVVTGAKGRVGQLLTRAIEEDEKSTLVLKISAAAEKNLLLDPKLAVDVLIDFSTPKAAIEYAAMARQLKIPMVIGTTGFSAQEKTLIHDIAHEIPLLFSPNMSVGVNITYPLLALVANILKGEADVGILDVHRRHKKDAPSGTALRMGEVIQQSGGAAEKIQYSSLRLGETVCDHSVLFCWEDEQLEITHRATSRSSFAKGALKAAKWILDKKPGLYDMQHVLGIPLP